MDDVLYWTVVGAFGQWASAIATFGAVVVALYIALREGRVRFKIQVNPGLDTTENKEGVVVDTAHVVFVEVVNTSLRPATIIQIGFRLPNGGIVANLPLRTRDDRTLPHRLLELDTFIAWIVQADLATALKGEGFTSYGTLWAFVTDAAGRRHWSKWKTDPSNWPGVREDAAATTPAASR